GPWTVTVAWGDGTPNTTFGTTAAGSLGTQPHTYAEEGTYTVTVTVTNNSTSGSGSGMFQVSVADQNVAAVGGFSVTAAEGALSATQTVATFTDPAGPEANDGTHYSASINWGDGTAPSTGTISIAAGSTTFTVLGNHTYAEEGTYTITVTINHEATTPQTVTDTATVSNPAVVGSALTVTATAGAPFFNKAVANFTDPGGAEPNPSDPAGTINNHYAIVSINWGDGTPLDTTTGTLSYSGSPGSKTNT